MKVIWVLENIHNDKGFYSKFNILLLLASVTLWKRNHPTHRAVLYCDDLTKETLTLANAIHLWDEIVKYEHTYKIKRSVFWAANKVKTVFEQREPFVIMDNDTLVFKPMDEYLKDEVLVANLETGKGYYPGNIDQYVKRLSNKVRWQQDSLNVSFLYFPDPKLSEFYGRWSLEMMEEFSAMNVPNSQYLIFAEQLLLRWILDNHPEFGTYKSIISTYWDCNKWDWGEDHDKGLWPFPESELYFKHYGPGKRYVIKDGTDLGYKGECELLINAINLPDLNLDHITKK